MSFIDSLTNEEKEQYALEIANDDYQAEIAYQELVEEQRECYQLSQIGIRCTNCRGYKFDTSVPF